MINTGLTDKVVLITGANHGIGAAAAKAFAAEGAAVFINYLRLPPLGTLAESNEAETTDSPGLALYNARRTMTADDVVIAIREQGGIAEALEADLSYPATIPLLFDRAETAFGRVDILVNNADYGNADTFIPRNLSGAEKLAPAGYAVSAITATSHDQHFAVNSRAVALMMAEYARRYVERAGRWGRIVNVSTDGASCFPGEISYGASKYAMESYSRSAAMELGRYGITVNVVAPGPTQTGWLTPELEESVIAEIPLKRVGQPDDVADVIVFLASEQARWLTGQTLYVGGGHKI
ncbi:MAG: SDR family NAD(P)-dependent oxidoreductase [Ktedonobacteraceae bacterium]